MAVLCLRELSPSAPVSYRQGELYNQDSLRKAPAHLLLALDYIIELAVVDNGSYKADFSHALLSMWVALHH